MEGRERQMQEVTLQLVQQAPHVELRVTEKMLRGIRPTWNAQAGFLQELGLAGH